MYCFLLGEVVLVKQFGEDPPILMVGPWWIVVIYVGRSRNLVIIFSSIGRMQMPYGPLVLAIWHLVGIAVLSERTKKPLNYAPHFIRPRGELIFPWPCRNFSTRLILSAFVFVFGFFVFLFFWVVSMYTSHGVGSACY